METKTSYAILMTRKIIDCGIYLFVPQYLIEGEVIGQDDNIIFMDQLGTEYLTIHDICTLNSDNELGVGYIISEDDLLNKYPEYSIQEAKAEYFDEIYDMAHIGFCLDEDDKIVVWNVNLMEIASKINNKEITYEENIVRLNSMSTATLNQQTNEYGSNHVIAITDKKFNQLLKLDNYKDIKKELEKIYKENEERIDCFSNQDSSTKVNEFMALKPSIEELDGTKIKEFFKRSYLFLSSLDDLDQMKLVLDVLQDFYLDICLEIDKNNYTGIDLESEKDYLYQLIDIYKKLESSNDLKFIKRELAEIFKTEEKLNLTTKKYDELLQAKKRKIELEQTFNNEETKFDFDVKDIKKYFDSIIIGQEKAKKTVISAIITNKLGDSKSKNSCLLVGPTGSGKTLIAETVSEYFKVPILIIDTTQLTVPGYQGSNIEDFLSQLLVKANGDIKKAEEGIVVLDEIDKKGSEKNDDVSGKGVLNSLLPFLQGTTYNLKYNGKNISFDTSKLTIFATGAFTDVAKHKNDGSNYTETKIGFNRENSIKDSQDIKYPKFTIEDFVKYGNMPIELMGRFSNIVQLEGHTKESLKTILIDSKRSPLIAEKTILDKLHVNLTWTEDYLDAVAEKALYLKTGARSLKSTVEESISEVRWEIFENIEMYSQIILSKETVFDNTQVKLIDHEGSIYNLSDLRSCNEQKVYQKTK